MRIFTVLSSLLMALSVSNICVAQRAESFKCLDISVTKTNSSIVEAPGYYCLKRDLHVDGRLNPFKHGHQLSSDDDVLMTIAHNDVILDMKAFKLTSDAALDAGGIQSPTETFSRVTTGLLKQYPNADGRGTIICILDDGVDPGIEGLLKTSDGKTKIIDVQDFSGTNTIRYSLHPTLAISNYSWFIFQRRQIPKTFFENKSVKTDTSNTMRNNIELKYTRNNIDILCNNISYFIFGV